MKQQNLVLWDYLRMVDKYIYPGTRVLINKLDIKDEKKIDGAEYSIVSLNINNLIRNPILIRSLKDIFVIHKILFSDLYEWAGNKRNINIYKEEPILAGLSVNYSDYNSINTDLNKLDKEFIKMNWKELKSKEKIDKIVWFISKLWRIHPFREGNTRTVTTFLYLFVKQIELKVNTDFIGKHAKYFRNALVMASIDEYSEYEHLTNILMDSISLKEINENKYKTIKEYEVEKYAYQTHNIKNNE